MEMTFENGLTSAYKLSLVGPNSPFHVDLKYGNIFQVVSTDEMLLNSKPVQICMYNLYRE